MCVRYRRRAEFFTRQERVNVAAMDAWSRWQHLSMTLHWKMFTPEYEMNTQTGGRDV